MSQPLLNGGLNSGDRLDADAGSVSSPPLVASVSAAKPDKVWRPVIVRVVLGGLALLGLAGVGAVSMVAGLDGARANPPTPSAANSGMTGFPLASAANASQATSTIPPGGKESAPGSVSPAPTPAPDACTAGRTPDGKVILNLATVTDLRTLPNIGQKRAEAILTLREKLKRFHRVQELRRVRGIGAKTLQKLSPKILIDPPPGSCPPVANTDVAVKKT